MMMAVYLAVVAFGVVAAGVAVIVRLDATPARMGRHAPRARLTATAFGFRARRGEGRKASPVLFLLCSVLTLLVIAALV